MRWTTLCLARSQPIQIIVHAEWLRELEYETARHATLPLVYPELHRISSLRVSVKGDRVHPWVLDGVFAGLNSAPAPHLADVFLSFDGDEYNHSGSVIQSTRRARAVELPPMFIGARLDALMTASFRACRLPFINDISRRTARSKKERGFLENAPPRL